MTMVPATGKKKKEKRRKNTFGYFHFYQRRSSISEENMESEKNNVEG